jgi:ABC-2 type transport system ATP-binding protein
MIEVERLTKQYRVHERPPGLAGSLKAVFRRRYRTVDAVDGISFRVAAGEVVGFLGPNGAGKTTTLKMLAGLLHPTAGRVTVAGFVPQRRERAFLESITLVMGQKQQLVWDLPAADTFLVNQAIYDIPDAEYRRRLGELADMLELGPIMLKPVRKLSLGERMKCELAAALLHRPKVLFLDEPTIGLDVNMQQAVRDFVAAYNRQHGATILLTSHYMADVTALARRILVIEGGRLIFDGDLGRLVEERAPHKILTLRFAEPPPAEMLARFGTVRRLEEREAELLVPRRQVTEVAAALLGQLALVDIAIEEAPIEEIVGELFGRAAAPAAGEAAAQ